MNRPCPCPGDPVYEPNFSAEGTGGVAVRSQFIIPITVEVARQNSPSIRRDLHRGHELPATEPLEGDDTLVEIAGHSEVHDVVAIKITCHDLVGDQTYGDTGDLLEQFGVPRGEQHRDLRSVPAIPGR